ncbi:MULTISPECIES: hypothetical protein [Burkholderia]|uniref:hypothetical protein n=1 Tax=Burkholderia TaxID=32008 RepID=UPI000A6C328E|nr:MULTISPECIES: hypothetical protein [Burkholderia]
MQMIELSADEIRAVSGGAVTIPTPILDIEKAIEGAAGQLPVIGSIVQPFVVLAINQFNNLLGSLPSIPGFPQF